MSTSPDPPTNDNASRMNALNGGTLRVDVATLTTPDLDRIVDPICGVCPLDEPMWHAYTSTDDDRRTMRPHSIRYASSSKLARRKNQDSITQLIWQEVCKLLVAGELPPELPTILFDYAPSEPHKAVIDIVFSSSDAAIEIFNTMRTITIEDDGKHKRTFTFTAWCNSLSGDVLPIDFSRLPLEKSNGDVMMKSLNRAVSEVGGVSGMGRFKITTPQERLLNNHELVVRAYVKLSRASMGLPFSQLIGRLPSHFIWYGSAYRLQHPGWLSRKEVVHSADYPLQEDEAEAPSAHEASSAEQSSAQQSSTADEPSNGANKRRRTRK